MWLRRRRRQGGHSARREGIAGLRDFALGTELSALAKPLAGMLFVLALSWNGGPKRIAIEISSDVMILALFAGAVAALAWAMRRAALLAEKTASSSDRHAHQGESCGDAGATQCEVRELAEYIGITEANLSLLKQGKVKGMRFDTLEAICRPRLSSREIFSNTSSTTNRRE